ncbi:MAG: hypothetical protein ACJA08_000205 [Cyclobacteriaceae bacterium]|jgi:hypothetical protein
MKKLLTILSISFCIAMIAPSCSSSDESFEDIVLNSELDQTAPTQGEDGSGGSSTPTGN